MLDLVVRHQGLIRELINGSAMVLFLTLTCMITVFMWDTMLASKGRDWTHAPGIGTACALWWIFAAETYRCGAVWALYQLGKGQGAIGVFFGNGAYWSSYGYLLAGIALNGGLLRAIYIFTPPDWKSKVWVYALVASNLFIATPSIIFLLTRIYIDGF